VTWTVPFGKQRNDVFTGFRIMIPHAGRRFIGLLLNLLWILALAVSASALDTSGAVVRNVLDGDTLVLSSGERVRLLGLDAPERGEALSWEARNRLLELAGGKVVELRTCSERDQYDRMLAVVMIEGGLNVNITLLEEGLAVPMLIPPCGKMVTSQVLRAAEAAIGAGRGIYSRAGYRIVNHEAAGEHIGQRAVVRGKITALHKGKKAWHLNFGDDWRTDFTAVLFSEGRLRFEALGVNPEDLVGREVLVLGLVKSYNGPEIIVRGPEQIIPIQ
jgi:micrococcal nuclease